MLASQRRIILFAALLAAPSSLATVCPTEKPVLFLVQDKSGSMAQVPDPSCANCPSKWSSAKAVVPALAQKFATRFAFGLQMFPRDSATFNCTTGTTLDPVPATANQIASTYAAVSPGGGTPTALSLNAARTYLSSLSSTAPKYVLLITDGLPNCNLALDPYTCATTTAGCLNLNTCSGGSCCGLGPKDCLDDAATRNAAAALKTAGFKVYVVGFGTGATGNNKAVLDGVAQAGGSGAAYAVSDQAGLSATLDAIGQNLSNCCQDACTQGAARCTAAGELETCVMNVAEGCTEWKTSGCAYGTECVGGKCENCTDRCALGTTRCGSEGVEQCVTGAGGCTEWQVVDACTQGQTCAAGDCRQTCVPDEFDTCPVGQVCTTTPEGSVCLARPDSGTGGGPTDPPVVQPPLSSDGGLPGDQSLSMRAGCGCQGSGLAGSGWGLWLLGLMLAAAGRRASRRHTP